MTREQEMENRLLDLIADYGLALDSLTKASTMLDASVRTANLMKRQIDIINFVSQNYVLKESAK